MDLLRAYLPPLDQGLLPPWLLFISAVSVFNSVQNYLTVDLTRRVYAARPQDVNALSSRTFGTWTLLAAVVRAYAAYNLADPAVYDLTLWSYVIAAFHFVSEWLVFGTAELGKGLAGPLVVATTSIAWMVTQRGQYV